MIDKLIDEEGMTIYTPNITSSIMDFCKKYKEYIVYANPSDVRSIKKHFEDLGFDSYGAYSIVDLNFIKATDYISEMSFCTNGIDYIVIMKDVENLVVIPNAENITAKDCTLIKYLPKIIK